MHRIKIGFYGMTHLGLVSAVAAASKSFSVIGFDDDTVLIQQLQNKIFSIEEPQLVDLLLKNEKNLVFTSSIAELLTADLIYIAIDVPTDTQNKSDYTPIIAAIERLRQQLQPNQILVILSQVYPGFTRKHHFPSQQLFYQVETLVFGRAIERATLPERFIVGCASGAQTLPLIYQEFLNAFDCPILPMRYESAEFAKISINMYLVSSVMTSNMLAELAAAIEADWQEIIPALRLDKRIGEHAYLQPGLGISGGNLERDIQALLQQANAKRTHGILAKLWLRESNYYKHWVWRCLQQQVFPLGNCHVIALLGLAYKANTHSIKNSPSLTLLTQLTKTKIAVQVHDPVVEEKFMPPVKQCGSISQTLKSADVVVIMTPWEDYINLSPDQFLLHMRGRIIIDPYRVLNAVEFSAAGFSLFTLGAVFSGKSQGVAYA